MRIIRLLPSVEVTNTIFEQFQNQGVLMIKILILFIFFSVSSLPQSIKTKLDRLFEDKFFESCLISIQVEDLTTDKTLYKKNEKMLLRPASNMKIITSSAGLLYLGLDYKFKTDLYHDGYVSNDTLYGNIYIVGGCDPDFTTRDLYYFVDTLKSLSISTITGNLYGDISFKDSLYWGKGWMWDDDPSSYAPYLSALNINDNCIKVMYDGKKNETEISPRTKYVNVHRTENEDKIVIDRNWLDRKNDFTINGKNNGKTYFAKINVLDPAKYFITVFAEVLDSNSIKLKGNLDLKKTPLYAKKICTFTRTYGDIIENLNKTSDNLSAEMTLYALAEKYSGKPAIADSGIQFINMMIDSSGLDHEDYRLVDGSGASHYNVVSVELITALLKYYYDKHQELYEVLYNSFPIAGVDGTLENRMSKTPAEKNVHAKTGTLTGVSCLSGYVTAKNNQVLAFSIMMQSFVGSSKRARDLQDEICNILADYK